MVRDIINQQSSKVPATQHLGLIPVYGAFIAAAVWFLWVPESDFSSMLTLSVMCQCLAFCLLGVHALSTGSMQGISAKSLQLQGVAVACRLSSTLWLNGYVPTDHSGDFMYQSFDILSFAMVLWLVLKARRGTHESGNDTLPVTPFAVGSLVLAGLLHADLDGWRGIVLGLRIFDVLWMCGVFIGALTMLPQLWLTTRSSAKFPAVMNHFVAVMACSCILSGSYMWYAHEEFTSKTWINMIFNLSGYAVLAAHVVQWTLLAGFGYFSVKTFAAQGFRSEPEHVHQE